MATNPEPTLISRREHRAVLATKGLSPQEAYSLCRTIDNTEGWFARMVPAWSRGTPPTERTFWVKCCRWKGHAQSRWYYLDNETQWNEIRASLEPHHEPAPSASDQPSTCSATEEESTPPAIDTSEVSVPERLEISESQQSLLKGYTSSE